jgi:hypothetical protein
MKLIQIFFFSILGFLIIIFVLLLLAAITGRDKRAYDILPKDKKLKLEARKISLSNVADQYKPKIYLRPMTPSPPLKWVWYEAIQDEDTIFFALLIMVRHMILNFFKLIST